MALIDKLTAIGNAIRNKTGGTELIPLSDMPTAIESIQSGDSVNKLPEFFAGELYGHRVSITAEDFGELTSIRKYAFAGAFLESVYIPDTITDYGSHLFASSDISDMSKIRFSANVQYIGDYMFNLATFGTSNIVIPEGITVLKPRAFMKAMNFSTMQLPSTLTSIETYAFQATSIEEVTIPASVTTIGANAFGSCSNLKTVIFEGTPTTIDSTAFKSSPRISNIYVPWAEGEVANAPWGAPTSATIHYNSTGGTN